MGGRREGILHARKVKLGIGGNGWMFKFARQNFLNWIDRNGEI